MGKLHWLVAGAIIVITAAVTVPLFMRTGDVMLLAFGMRAALVAAALVVAVPWFRAKFGRPQDPSRPAPRTMHRWLVAGGILAVAALVTVPLFTRTGDAMILVAGTRVAVIAAALVLAVPWLRENFGAAPVAR